MAGWSALPLVRDNAARRRKLPTAGRRDRGRPRRPQGRSAWSETPTPAPGRGGRGGGWGWAGTAPHRLPGVTDRRPRLKHGAAASRQPPRRTFVAADRHQRAGCTVSALRTLTSPAGRAAPGTSQRKTVSQTEGRYLHPDEIKGNILLPWYNDWCHPYHPTLHTCPFTRFHPPLPEKYRPSDRWPQHYYQPSTSGAPPASELGRQGRLTRTPSY